MTPAAANERKPRPLTKAKRPPAKRSPRRLLAEPSPSDWERWEAKLAEGVEPSLAAQATHQTTSAFRRQDPDRHAELLALSREARAEHVDRTVERWATTSEDAPVPIRLAWMKRWNPAYADKAHVVGADGGPVEVQVVVEHTPEQVAAILQRLERLGLVQPGPRLAAHAQGQPLLAAPAD